MKIDLAEGRYDRQQLISWWDQERLAAASVLLVGAGALGNEIAKNLALVGFGATLVVDMDRIERSNFARCALFREDDEGELKAQVVADRMREINPTITAQWFAGPVEDLGIGILEDVDLVIAGLDSRVARLWLNRAARKMGRPWVDGAIEGVRGLARVFLPDGPCYECTLGEVDRRILANRRSCALLTAEEMLEGKVPTNATTAAVIGGVEVQEAIKLLHPSEQLLTLAGRSFVFAGETMETYVVDYAEDEFCLSHETFGPRTRVLAAGADTLRTVIERGLSDAGGLPPSAVVRLEQEIVIDASCVQCNVSTTYQRALRTFGASTLVCAGCSKKFALEVGTRFTLDDPVCAVPLAQLGLARHDVVVVEWAGTDGSPRWVSLLVDGAEEGTEQ